MIPICTHGKTAMEGFDLESVPGHHLIGQVDNT